MSDRPGKNRFSYGKRTYGAYKYSAFGAFKKRGRQNGFPFGCGKKNTGSQMGVVFGNGIGVKEAEKLMKGLKFDTKMLKSVSAVIAEAAKGPLQTDTV